MNDVDNEFKLNTYCPYCSKFFDRATSPEDFKLTPNPGDISICIDCGETSKFDEKMKLIKVDVSTLDLQMAREINIMQVSLQQTKRTFHLYKKVLDFFQGNEEKTKAWFSYKNPLLGGVSPADMINNGREKKLELFITNSLQEIFP